MITLRDFIYKSKRELDKFQDNWNAQYDKKKFPEKLSEADWTDQFIAFCLNHK